MLLATDDENIEPFMYRVQHKQQKVEIKKSVTASVSARLSSILNNRGRFCLSLGKFCDHERNDSN